MNDENVRIKLKGKKILIWLFFPGGLLAFTNMAMLFCQSLTAPSIPDFLLWFSLIVSVVTTIFLIVVFIGAYRSMVFAPFVVSSEGITCRCGWNQSESLVSWEEMDGEDIGATPPSNFNPFWYVYRKNRYGEKRPVAQFPPLDWIENLDDVKPLLENAPKNRLTDAILK